MSEINFNDFAANMPGVLYRFRLSKEFAMSFDYVSDSAVTLFGRTSVEILEVGVNLDHFHPDDRKPFTESIMFSAETLTRWRWSGRYFRKDGRMIWLEGASIPTREDNGDIVWNGFLWDVTERKMLEQLMVDEKIQLEMIASGVSLETVLKNICLSVEGLVNDVRCAIYLKDGDRLYTGAAPSMPEGFRKSAHGRLISEEAGPSSSAVFFDADFAVEDMDSVSMADSLREFLRSNDILACWSRPIHSSTGEIIGVFSSYFRTKRKPREDEKIAVERSTHLASIAIEKSNVSKKIEEQRAVMISSSRLSTLGEMAAGVAHEINNPLAIIFGNASNILEMADENRFDAVRVKKYAEKILNTSERIARITRGLKTISRDGSHDPFVSSSFKNIVADAVDFCNTRFKHHDVELRIAEIPAELNILCRPVQISQVILNLLNNAFDAIQDRKEPWVELSFGINEGFIQVSVTDSGEGISPEIAEKIMLPFFTTKEVGKGTGLGLSIVSSIIKEHKGEFTLDANSPNTRFCFTLPLS